MSDKLTKKQRKALEFRNKVDKKDKKPQEEFEKEKAQKIQEKNDKKRKSDSITKDSGDEPLNSDKPQDEAPKKKRKTRRGKKGKGVNGGKGPRFILFVGNLPYDITEVELMSHFKNSNPDRIRIRNDKGIAFLEFDNDTKEIQSKMELALRMHHSVMRERKINVELTVGGGGNSDNRKQKIKDKNDKLIDERRERVKTESKSSKPSSEATEGIHPSRLNMVDS